MNLLWYAVIIIGLVPLLLVLFKKTDEDQAQPGTNTTQNGGSNNAGNNTTVSRRGDLSLSGNKVCLNAKAFLQEDELFENRNNQKESGSIDEFNNDERIKSLKDLVKSNDVYLICQVSSDEEQNYYQDLLETRYGFFNQVKTLFCETWKGKIAFCRQINPQLCFEVDRETTRELIRFYQNVYMIKKQAKNGLNEDKVLEFSTIIDAITNASKRK